jgi:hypothetical protein
MTGRKNTKHIQLRLPEWMYKKIRETAEEERRSVTNWIVWVLERYFIDKEKED